MAKVLQQNLFEQEIWKTIKGYEGCFEISSHGRVRRLSRPRSCDENGKVSKELKGRIMKPTCDKDGYLLNTLWNGTRTHTYKAHRLVAQAFIPNPDNKPCVNHKDANKQNNHVDNLEWATYSENSKHAYSLGLTNPNACRANSEIAMRKKYGKPIYAYYADSGILAWESDSIRAAVRNYGLDQKTINNVLKGRKGCKQHRGFVFKYAPIKKSA